MRSSRRGARRTRSTPPTGSGPSPTLPPRACMDCPTTWARRRRPRRLRSTAARSAPGTARCRSGSAMPAVPWPWAKWLRDRMGCRPGRGGELRAEILRPIFEELHRPPLGVHDTLTLRRIPLASIAKASCPRRRWAYDFAWCRPPTAMLADLQSTDILLLRKLCAPKLRLRCREVAAVRAWGSIPAGLIAAACASSSEAIKPSYVSPLQYQNLTCQQIGQEMERVSRRASEGCWRSGQQQNQRCLGDWRYHRLVLAGRVLHQRRWPDCGRTRAIRASSRPWSRSAFRRTAICEYRSAARN